MKLTTTINKILSLNPRRFTIDSIYEKLGKDYPRDKEFAVADLVGGENTIGDVIWYLEASKNSEILPYCMAVAVEQTDKTNLEILNTVLKRVLS